MVLVKRLIAAVGIVLMLNACSVGLALHGQEDPDLQAVRIGAVRADVEKQLGKPVRTVSLAQGGTAEAYAYQIDNEPSVARAFGHALVDLVTLFIWEAVGTPMERDHERKHHLAVRYDAEGRVLSVQPIGKPDTLKSVAAAPAPAPKPAPAPPPAPAKEPTTPSPTVPAAKAVETSPAPAPPVMEEGHYRIQLAAYRSQVGAVREAGRLRGKWPEIFARRILVIEEKKLPRRGTFYRVQLGGFATMDAARAMCKVLIAGRQPCFPVKR